MILNKEYDNSLWAIINGDKQHNHLITNFIHELPSEFIEQIKLAIIKRESIMDNRFKNLNYQDGINTLSGTTDSINNVKYTYLLDVDFGELRIMKTIVKDNSFENVFTLHLEEISLPLTSVLDNGTLLGSLEYQVKEKKYFQDFPIINNYHFEYGISKNMFSHTVTTTEVCGNSRLSTKQSIDIEKLPTNLNLKNIPLITKKLTIERMVELEKYLRNETIIDTLLQEDITYLEIAKKFPLEEFLKDREYYIRNIPKIDEIEYIYYLMNKYNCTKEELYNRITTANAIKRYNNKLFNHMYKMRKRTIKQLTK